VSWKQSLEQALVGKSLLGRFSRLTAAMVAVSILVLSGAGYLLTRISFEQQMDSELLTIAEQAAQPLSDSAIGLGGLNATVLNASNVLLVLVAADGSQVGVPGEQLFIQVGADELAIAKTQLGYSARNGKASNGQDYRVVSVPIGVDTTRYALVLARQLNPVEAALLRLRTLFITLGCAFVVTAALLGYLAGRSVVRPIRELADAAAHVASTDELLPVGTDADNEVGELARSFDTMMASLATSRDRQKRLIVDAGHELRTPLTSLRTNIELLVADEQSKMLPAGARGEILSDVAAQLGEFTSLVNDLVQLSRDDSTTPVAEPTDLAEVAERAIARAKRRSHSVSFDVDLLPFVVTGDPEALERAVMNLVDNAIKFSPPNGTVHVRLADGVLTVTDEGPGIAEEDLPHVFERFFRSDKARNTPGTGLGLSIVNQTINAHGGTIEATNAPAGGAVFTVHLPSL